ncbi:MAG: hypothetical protein H0U71_09670 [Gammaproteobacteria bacterium]|nr:hypothetical protein [Gammaproteobacteria bacterium]
MTQHAWIVGALFYLLLWCILFVWRKEFRKEMLIVSLFTLPLGLTEPLFVPSYWHPPSLFNLAMRTGFDIESLIFSFAIGGIAAVIYQSIFKVQLQSVSKKEMSRKRHRWHGFILMLPAIIFALLAVLTSWNNIYSASIALFVGSLAAGYCRPDLKKKIWVGGLLFLFLYSIFFWVLIFIFPDFVKEAWNLSALSGILTLGIPIEELLFAFTFGMLWSSLYEHFFWLKCKDT